MPDNSLLLLVDDDDDSILLLESALERAEVANPRVVAHSGKEAIDYLSGSGAYADRKKFPLPGLMLLDLKMPGVDGFGVLDWCRGFTKGKDLQIVVMTASNNESDRERAMSLGAAAYYVKPVSFSNLVEIVREVQERWLKAAEVPGGKKSSQKNVRAKR